MFKKTENIRGLGWSTDVVGSFLYKEDALRHHLYFYTILFDTYSNKN